ncbi:MAG: alcohol dehydrogenase [Gammaproteobacteria bacterium]|nr:alcohol dehydrogenase [Gammaproteobacteria bacterium]HJP17171.1 phosphonoacetaldehyde reductase [Nitrospinota bacterium]|tara:strand:+ start:48136 stop:49236 length:1101 start_codon:yes stop_codon:yes gene_type:complete
MKCFKYYNPVRIEFGTGKLDKLDDFVGNRKALLITSKSFSRRGLIQKIQSLTDKIEVIIDSVNPNPTFKNLKSIYESVWQKKFDVIIALGGGSVIDTSKVISVYNKDKNFTFIDSIIRKKNEREGYRLIPFIAIPTTSGTGSEVTCWATVWDSDEKKKYSLHLEDLWSEVSICDPELTLSLQRDLTVQTALDALSHSLESIWNRNANPISTNYAIVAAKEIVHILPKLINDLGNIEYRERMMFAALNAGLAFSNTQTAIAHAISYYLTANKGIPHGIASSFFLPNIIDLVVGMDENVDSAIINIFGELSGNKLRDLYREVNISMNIDHYLDTDELKQINEYLIKNERSKNFLFDKDIVLCNLRKIN